MAKSIKLKNDTFWDAEGITFTDNYGKRKTGYNYLTLRNVIHNLDNDNADLNNLTTYGWYAWSAGIRPTHCPADGCTMVVIPHNWGCIQIATSYVNNITFYVRKRLNWQGWSDWKKFDGVTM